MTEEGKRKRRIAAGGCVRLAPAQLLNRSLRRAVVPVPYSHRLLSLRPSLVAALAALVPLNIALPWSGHPTLYAVILALQVILPHGRRRVDARTPRTAGEVLITPISSS